MLDRNDRSILRDPAREILTLLIPQNEPVKARQEDAGNITMSGSYHIEIDTSRA